MSCNKGGRTAGMRPGCDRRPDGLGALPVLAQRYPNVVDAAIARVKSGASVTSAIRVIGVPTGVSRTVRRGMQVQKTGRTTDYTVGIINDINYRTSLRYKRPGGGRGRVGFRDQVRCSRSSAGGDSGSAVLNMKKEVVGFHFAGRLPPASSTGLATCSTR